MGNFVGVTDDGIPGGGSSAMGRTYRTATLSLWAGVHPAHSRPQHLTRKEKIRMSSTLQGPGPATLSPRRPSQPKTVAAVDPPAPVPPPPGPGHHGRANPRRLVEAGDPRRSTHLSARRLWRAIRPPRCSRLRRQGGTHWDFPPGSTTGRRRDYRPRLHYVGERPTVSGFPIMPGPLSDLRPAQTPQAAPPRSSVAR